jgi:hypothetical protein
MPRYSVMRESFQSEQGYLPGVVWVFDGNTIHLGALPSFDSEREALQAQIDSALADGFNANTVWSYWVQQGGSHQLSQRSEPVSLVATDLRTAMNAALASLHDLP